MAMPFVRERSLTTAAASATPSHDTVALPNDSSKNRLLDVPHRSISDTIRMPAEKDESRMLSPYALSEKMRSISGTTASVAGTNDPMRARKHTIPTRDR